MNLLTIKLGDKQKACIDSAFDLVNHVANEKNSKDLLERLD